MTALCASQNTLQSAHQILRLQAIPLDRELIPVIHGGLRVLARDVKARIDSPREDVAAMDGFAVEDQAVQARKQEFRLDGVSYPGDAALCGRSPETAVRVTTGAPMPQSKDRVIPFELVDEKNGIIRLLGAVPKNLHVRQRGSGFKKGQTLLPAGTLLDVGRLMVMVSSDQSHLEVYRQPRLSVLTSGDELTCEGGAGATEQGVPDSLTLPLLLMARQWGAVPIRSTLVPDNIEAIRSAAILACVDSDVLVIAGGASFGERDFARLALNELGLKLSFAGVAIKPGKPLWYGRIGKLHVLGLPGNPAAAITTARLFLAPMLCALAGRGFDAALAWRRVLLARPAPVADAREMFLFARGIDNRVSILPRQSASAQLPLASADMLVRLPARGSAQSEDSSVTVLDL